MKRTAITILISLVIPLVCIAQQTNKLEASNFLFMLRGYCYAGSSIVDTNALGGFGTSDNLPKKVDATIGDLRDEVYLMALPKKETSFAEKYKDMTLLLVNGTDKIQAFMASDSRVSIIQEAKDKDGKWKPIEYLPSSWDGNSYHSVFLGPKEYWSFSAPRYEGSLETVLRFSLSIGKDKSIYSNEFNGSVNPQQFTEKQGHKPTNLMDPYNE